MICKHDKGLLLQGKSQYCVTCYFAGVEQSEWQQAFLRKARTVLDIGPKTDKKGMEDARR